MKTLNENNSVFFNSGIYCHSKYGRNEINGDTRRKTARKRLARRITRRHYMENKLKIAVCIFLAVAIIVNLLVG